MNVLLVTDGAGAFDAASDAVEYFEAGAGVLTCGGFSRKHDRIGPFKDRVGNVGNLRTGGEGIGDHAFEHVGGDDDRFHGGDTLVEDPALDDRELFVGAFDAKVAAGNHDGIGGRDDPEDVFDGKLVLDLGDDFHISPIVLIEEITEGDDIVGVADKGESNPVDPSFKSDEKVGGILFGDGGKIDADAGQIDVSAIAQGAGGEDAAVEGSGIFFEDLEMDDPVIDEKFLARGKIPNEIRVVDGDGGSGGFGIDREDQFVTDSKLAGFANGSGTDSRSLGIEEEGDFLATIRRERAEDGSDGSDEFVGSVGHIEAKNLGSAVDELREGGGVGVFGA